MIAEGDFIAALLSLACPAVFILAGLWEMFFCKDSGGGSGRGIDLPGRGDEAHGGDVDDGGGGE